LTGIPLCSIPAGYPNVGRTKDMIFTLYLPTFMNNKMGESFGGVLNPSKSITENPPDWDIKTICDNCVEQLSREKGITPYILEDWKRLLEGIL
jgi:hypothetical protein